ncbi:MAG TPA: GNAT family N-acetyltransferase [Caulobacteraceae bacterium]|nr:GNAT family N-acetyltransferase [Caulobacteraceae bacterium]
MSQLQEVFRPSTRLEPADIRFVAAIADRPVGMVELTGSHVSNLFVDPAYQGQGIGAALLARAEAAVGGDVTLSVFTVNPRARRLYERLGYEVEGVARIDFYGAATEVWRMRKRAR